jgi:inhibitor of KinA
LVRRPAPTAVKIIARVNWIPYGPDAWLLKFAEQLGPQAFAQGRAIAVELERHPPAGLREFVSGFTTVLLEFAPGALKNPAVELARLRDRFKAAARHPPKPGPIQEIPVIYDGPDLLRVAEAHGLTPTQVAALHCAPVYHVYLIGFSPGFPYLGDLDPRLHTPRLPSPRPRVAAGSVAIGGEHTGIYSVDSPGGWNIVGRTPVTLFQAETWLPSEAGQGEAGRFRLRAGDRVKFVPIPTG